MKEGERRPYSETELRKYRSDKRRPRRTVITATEDLGDKIRIRSGVRQDRSSKNVRFPKRVQASGKKSTNETDYGFAVLP